MKALILVDSMETDLLGRVGDHIKWHNEEFDANWKIIKLPDRLPSHGEVPSDSFRSGWNCYRTCLMYDISTFDLDVAYYEITKLFSDLHRFAEEVD